MIIEHFKNNDPAPVYRRFREKGRMASEGLLYLYNWSANWSDLIDFEVHPVISSAEATQRIAPRL